jgi:hypothetical protein
MKQIEMEWETYRHLVMPPQAGEMQFMETRRAFYAGAKAMFALISEISDPKTGPEATQNELQRVDGLANELEEFNQRIRDGKA